MTESRLFGERVVHARRPCALGKRRIGGDAEGWWWIALALAA